MSSPLLSGLLPVCKLSAMYREANEVREAAWATLLSGLQGMAPATGLHSPVCSARSAVLILGTRVKANPALNHCSSSAMRLEIGGPVPSPAAPNLL